MYRTKKMNTYAITPIGPILLNHEDPNQATGAQIPEQLDDLVKWMRVHRPRADVEPFVGGTDSEADHGLEHTVLKGGNVIAAFGKEYYAKRFLEAREREYPMMILGGFVAVSLPDFVELFYTNVEPIGDGQYAINVFFHLSLGSSNTASRLELVSEDSRLLQDVRLFFPDQWLAQEIKKHALHQWPDAPAEVELT